MVLAVDLFVWARTLGLTELNWSSETLRVEWGGTKADLLAERAFSVVWKVQGRSVALLKGRIVGSGFQKRFLVL
ncbi:hypothetical protein ATN50_23915 [Vibrio parahaemolyticus]|nr:hypothetical protein ATN50_23915 [Vibrio parahaemolyticus]